MNEDESVDGVEAADEQGAAEVSTHDAVEDLAERLAMARWRAARGLAPEPDVTEVADALEDIEFEQFERRVRTSVVFRSGATDPRFEDPRVSDLPEIGISSDDPRLPRMPAQPKLRDFFDGRFSPTRVHMLQSARLARISDLDDEVVVACLLHDIGMAGFIRGDHGYWGAQLVEPYVSEEISWSIRAHQALRFFPDESVGYEYPESYVRLFGESFAPPDYIREEYERARKHKWYMTARLITLNDLYSFDPDVQVDYDDFEDALGRQFRDPEQGLGFDNSPVAHMWRTMIWPTRSL